MNDPWKTSFQDRLGDYELDVPVPSPARRRAAWPWLLAAAAAAVIAAFFLLLPAREQNPDTQFLSVIIGEQPAALLAENILHPDKRFLPLHRAVRPETLGQLETANEEVLPSTLPKVDPDAVPKNDQDIIPEAALEAALKAMQEREPETGVLVSIPARRTGKLSVQIHAGYTRATDSAEGSLLKSTDKAKTPPDLEHIAFVNTPHTGQNNIFNQYNDLEQPEPDNWTCLLPAKAGLSLRYQITPSFGVESGILYSYHYAREFIGRGRKCHTHYLGIPLKASLRMAQWRRQQVYTTFGGEAEWLVGGHIDTPTAPGVQQVTSVRIKEHPFQYSLMGAAGIDFGLSKRLSLYVEPGLAWHFGLSGNLPNYYREHPVSFDLRAGLRFSL